MRLYDETCLALCEGQFMDIWTPSTTSWLSVDCYFDMIGRKTAALIAGSVQAGAMLATDDADRHRRVPRFGWALGLAFQLNDDLLGIWGDEQATGKEPSDLAEHKKTLPLIYALEEPPSADRERLHASSCDGQRRRPAELDEARAILERVRRPRLHARPGPGLPRRGVAQLEAAGIVGRRGAGAPRADRRSAISA